MKNTLVFAFTLCIFWAMGSACTRYENTTVEDRFQKIQAMIDQKQYEQAELELSAILLEEPDNQRARAISASIFVHKAGISVKDYFTLEKLTHLENEEDRSRRPDVIDISRLEKDGIKPDSDLGQALKFIHQINEAVIGAQEIAEKFGQIPELSDQNAEHIYSALKELEKIEDPDRGNALYRGVLKIIYFKYLWERNRFFSFGKGKFCSQTVHKLDRSVETFAKFTTGMIRDLALGFPKNEAQFNQAAGDLSRYSQMARLWLNTTLGPAKTLAQVIESAAKAHSISGVTCDF